MTSVKQCRGVLRPSLDPVPLVVLFPLPMFVIMAYDPDKPFVNPDVLKCASDQVDKFA